MKERRRFTDVMEEEMEIRREARLEAWGREDFSTFRPVKKLEGDADYEVEVRNGRP